jgi:chromosome segregation ATPase
MDSFYDSTFIGPIDTRIPLERRVAQLSDQLSSISLNHANHRTDLDSLFDKLNRIKTSFDNLANNIKDINSMKKLYSDFVQIKLNFNNEISRLQHSINGILQSVKNNRVAIQQNASQLIELARLPSGNTHEVPELQ